MKEYTLTTTDLQKQFNVVPSTIRKWVEYGLPCLNIGYGKNKRYRFNKEDVEEWIKKRQ